MRRFEPGEPIALREVWEGRVWSARPCTVVEDGPALAILYVPAGTRWMAAGREGRRLKIPQVPFEPLEQTADAHVLSFAWPGASAAALLLFGPDRSPLRWYVNAEEPLRRTPIGFDTLDRQLDAMVELDGSWRWKDEDELDEAIRRGVVDAGDAVRLRAEVERVVGLILDREPPFDRDWTGWRPDPAWPTPALPPGWDVV